MSDARPARMRTELMFHMTMMITNESKEIEGWTNFDSGYQSRGVVGLDVSFRTRISDSEGSPCLFSSMMFGSCGSICLQHSGGTETRAGLRVDLDLFLRISDFYSARRSNEVQGGHRLPTEPATRTCIRKGPVDMGVCSERPAVVLTGGGGGCSEGQGPGGLFVNDSYGDDDVCVVVGRYLGLQPHSPRRRLEPSRGGFSARVPRP